MEGRVKTWLSDISVSIEQIDSFISKDDGLAGFVKDLKAQRAVERNIEIIGEAMDRILTVDSNFPITDSRKIVDTRNRIIHGYESVSPDIIWVIVEKYLPVLKREVNELLNK